MCWRRQCKDCAAGDEFTACKPPTLPLRGATDAHLKVIIAVLSRRHTAYGGDACGDSCTTSVQFVATLIDCFNDDPVGGANKQIDTLRVSVAIRATTLNLEIG